MKMSIEDCATRIVSQFEGFHENLARVQFFINAAEKAPEEILDVGTGQGLPLTINPRQDLLRAAVVFLHASLDDMFKNLYRFYLSTTDKERKSFNNREQVRDLFTR